MEDHCAELPHGLSAGLGSLRTGSNLQLREL
jgi:hypothetical protein